MYAWSRLPTPIPPEDRERVSSLSKASIASNVSPPTSPTTDAKATQKSLSLFTAQVNDGLLPSPLPSPREASTNLTPSYSASIANSSGSKTAAFFGSPFTCSDSPTPPPPLQLAKMSPSNSVDNAASTNLTASSSSATASFFAVSSLESRPTPPPSIRSNGSSSSREPSPSRTSRMPPLSRFFPSRYVSERNGMNTEGEEDDTKRSLNHTRDSYGPGTDWETSFKRDFLEIREANLDPSLRWTSGARSPPLVMTSPTQLNATSPKADEFLLSPPCSITSHHRALPDSHKDLHPHHHISHQHHHTVPIRREPHMHLTATRAGSGDSGFEEVLPLSNSSSQSKQEHSNTSPLSALNLSTGASSLSNDMVSATTTSGLVSEVDGGMASSTNANVVVTTIGMGTRLVSGSGNAQMRLIRALGEGAFSSVWLAVDEGGNLSTNIHRSLQANSLQPHATVPQNSSLGLCIGEETMSRNTGDRSPVTLRRKSSSWAKKSRDKRLQGIVPPPNVSIPNLNWENVKNQNAVRDNVLLDELIGEGASATEMNQAEDNDHEEIANNRLVAVKVMNRALCDANDRTRISFVREVEVLRHISHPSIVSYLHSFTSDEFNCHCLVLEYVSGGELFNLVNSDSDFKWVTERAVRRMWGELARAVGWMHGVGLVHRDIKLENILLTRNIFADAASRYPRKKPIKNRKDSLSGQEVELPPSHVPLIKLSDFGLSRFIDPEAPLLSTRCGSESYAAPELVLGSSTRMTSVFSPADSAKKERGYYDGRQTDAWACGVVLYALATRQLPFDVPPPYHASSLAPSRNGSVRSTRSSKSSKSSRNSEKGEKTGGLDLVSGTGSFRLRATNKRRDVLMRIAQCEYFWPDEYDMDESEGNSDADSDTAVEDERPDSDSHTSDDDEESEDEGELPAQAAKRIASPGLKRVVRRLLERNPERRARMVDLWDEPWMRGEGAVAPPASKLKAKRSVTSSETHSEEPHWPTDDGETDEDVSHDGMLLDEEHIGSVASQEMEPL